MRRRYKIVFNLDIENPDDPFPAGGDYMHMSRVEGIIHAIKSSVDPFWHRTVDYSVTLDKVIEKGEIK